MCAEMGGGGGGVLSLPDPAAVDGGAQRCSWPMFRRLRRSVQRDATGSVGGWGAGGCRGGG